MRGRAFAISAPLDLSAMTSFKNRGALGGHYMERLCRDHAQQAQQLRLVPNPYAEPKRRCLTGT